MPNNEGDLARHQLTGAQQIRASSGYLVEVAGERLLFDCGGGVFDRLLQSGRGPADVDRLFFTHLHSDHMMDYPRLVHARWDEGAADLPVWGPASIATITDRYFGKHGALAFDLTARTEMPQSQAVWKARGGTLPRPWPQPNVTEIEPGFILNGDGWRLSSVEVPHAQPFLNCMAFRIDAGGKSVVYAGDSGHTPALEAFVQDADLLIHWCYRLSQEPLADSSFAATSPEHIETAEMAERAAVKHLVLTHFRMRHDVPRVLERIRDDIAEHYSGRFDIAQDLMEIEV